MLSITLFGPIRFAYNAASITAITSEKIHALVAYLALESNRPHPRDALAELLWPDRPPGTARQNLRQALSRLNRPLAAAGMDAPLLMTTQQTIAFNVEAVQIDVVRFVALFDDTRRHDHASASTCRRCCKRLAEAAELYQADFLAGLDADSEPFAEWALLKGEWLRLTLLNMLDILVAHTITQGEYERAWQYAWRQTEIDPLREEAHQQVMRTLALAGRPAEALAHYETCRTILHNELGVAPAAETTQLYEQIRSGTLGEEQGSKGAEVKTSARDGVAASPPALRNFPRQHTAFVGRRAERSAIDDLLDNPNCHLVTLVGYGGVGKTRLALEVAHARADEYAHGAAFVPLAAVSAGYFLPTAIARALDYTFSRRADSVDGQRQELLAHLRTQSLLLILDNAEQLLDAPPDAPLTFVDLVVDILDEAPQVTLLITSRTQLHLRAEWIVDVAGLDLPGDASPLQPTHLMTYSALHLFIQSMQRIQQLDDLSDEVAAAIVQICRSVQGSPLAIELAAAWARDVSCQAIAQRIAASLDFLTTTMRDVPLRHRSVRAVFNGSWSLLDEETQRAFCALAVFRGTFTGQAAAVVTGASQKTLDSLVTRSLLRLATEHDDEVRYELHEMLRQYAEEKLCAESALHSAVWDAHCRYYTDLVAAQEGDLQDTNLAHAVAQIDREISNVRAAWQRAVDQRTLAAIQRSSHGLLRYYSMTNQCEEGVAAYSVAIDMLCDDVVGVNPEHQFVLADLLALRSRMFFRLACYADAIADAEQVMRLAQAVDAPRPATLASLFWGMSLVYQGNHADALPRLTECLALARASGWRKLESDALRSLGIVADSEERLAEAAHYYRQALTISQEINDPRGTSAALGNLGSILRRTGAYEQAQRYLHDSLRIHQTIGDRSSEGRTFSFLGELATDLEEYDEAQSYLRQAIAILREIGERHYAADAVVCLGETYLRTGEVDAARVAWEEALLVYRELGETRRQEKVEGLLRAI